MIADTELNEALTRLAGRADHDPRPDRLDRVHRRARRTARNKAVAASAVAVVVVGGAAALMSRGAGTAAPIVPGSTVSTSPASPTPSTSEPTPTPTGKAALVPADSRTPSGGGCLTQPGAVVTVLANPDVPTPRCLVVRPDQRLRVVNNSDLQGSPPKTITVTWADYAPRVLTVGQATTYDRPFGDYLAVGVHNLRMDPLYAGSFGAVWLQ